MKSNKRLKNSLGVFSNKKVDKEEILSGELGIPQNGLKIVEVPNRVGYVYARLQTNKSELVQALNTAVPAVYGLSVKIRRVKNTYTVIGKEYTRYSNQLGGNSAGIIPLPRHGGQHSLAPELNMGSDPTWVFGKQFMPMLAYPSGSSMMLGLSPTFYEYNNQWLYPQSTGVPSFAPHVPTITGSARMALYWLDARDNSLNITPGALFSGGITNPASLAAFIPPSPDGYSIPLMAVKLSTGTASLDWNNIYDVRPFSQIIPTGSAGGSTGSSAISIQDEGILLGTPTTLNFVGGGVDVSISGSVARIHISGSAAGGVPALVGFNIGLPGVQVYLTGTVSTPNNTGTAIRFGAEIKDDWNGWSLADRTKIFFDEDSWYILGGELQWESNALGRRSIYIAITGTSTQPNFPGASSSFGHFNIEASADNSGPSLATSFSAYLTSGTWAELYGTQRSSGTLGVVATFPYTTSFWANKLKISGSVSSTQTTINQNLTVDGIVGWDEGVPKGTGTILNAVGDNISLSVSGSVIQIYVTGSSSSGGAVPHAPGGRLTLATGTPVMTSEQASKTAIHYLPYVGDLYPSFNGSVFTERTFSPLTLNLDSNTGTVGFHQSGKNFDLFVFNDGGTDRLVSSPAWTSDIARSSNIEYKNGILTNSASMTARYDSASGSVVTVPQYQGTYVGTFRASADGQTTWELGGDASTGDPAFLYLWNAYNRVAVEVRVTDNKDSWTYNAATWRAADNSNNNRVSFVVGLNEDGMQAIYDCIVNPGGVQNAVVGIGLDVTNNYSGTANIAVQSATAGGNQAHWNGQAGLGYHFLQAVEYQSSGTGTYYGDFGVTWLKTGLFVRGMF